MSEDRHAIATLLSCKSLLSFDVVLADSMRLPLEVASMIVKMLMKPTTYGIVLYRKACLEL
jgi:hypothetical protein